MAFFSAHLHPSVKAEALIIWSGLCSLYKHSSLWCLVMLVYMLQISAELIDCYMHMNTSQLLAFSKCG